MFNFQENCQWMCDITERMRQLSIQDDDEWQLWLVLNQMHSDLFEASHRAIGAQWGNDLVQCHELVSRLWGTWNF